MLVEKYYIVVKDEEYKEDIYFVHEFFPEKINSSKIKYHHYSNPIIHDLLSYENIRNSDKVSGLCIRRGYNSNITVNGSEIFYSKQEAEVSLIKLISQSN